MFTKPPLSFLATLFLKFSSKQTKSRIYTFHRTESEPSQLDFNYSFWQIRFRKLKLKLSKLTFSLFSSKKSELRPEICSTYWMSLRSLKSAWRVFFVWSQVGSAMSLVLLEPHHVQIGCGSVRFSSSGQSPRLKTNSASGSFTFRRSERNMDDMKPLFNDPRNLIMFVTNKTVHNRS